MLPRRPLQNPLGSPISPSIGERGVFEDEYALAGTEAHNVYGPDGERLGRWEAVAGVTDDELLDAFEALLERREVHPLRIMPPSSLASS